MKMDISVSVYADFPWVITMVDPMIVPEEYLVTAWSET